MTLDSKRITWENNSMYAWPNKKMLNTKWSVLIRDSIEEISKELDIWLRLKSLVLTQDEHQNIYKLVLSASTPLLRSSSPACHHLWEGTHLIITELYSLLSDASSWLSSCSPWCPLSCPPPPPWTSSPTPMWLTPRLTMGLTITPSTGLVTSPPPRTRPLVTALVTTLRSTSCPASVTQSMCRSSPRWTATETSLHDDQNYFSGMSHSLREGMHYGDKTQIQGRELKQFKRD